MFKNKKPSKSQKTYAYIEKSRWEKQYEAKKNHERAVVIKKAEDKVFEAFPQALKENFGENGHFVEKACTRLSQWPGRTLTGAVTILKLLVEEEFPQEQERFADFAQSQLEKQKKARMRAEMLFELNRR